MQPDSASMHMNDFPDQRKSQTYAAQNAVVFFVRAEKG